MTRGMSFQKGIIFIGKKYIACAYDGKGKRNAWIMPINLHSILKAAKLIVLSMPAWYYFLLFLLLALINIPSFFNMNGLPDFTLLYFLFGTHFWFPKELKKYHGAEHKIFNYVGVISVATKNEIKSQSLTNRYCSTNTIIIYFLSVILSFIIILLLSSYTWLKSLHVASYISIFLCLIFTYFINRKGNTFLHRFVLSLSYWFQENVTTDEPDEKHLFTGIRAYRLLAREEFPHRLTVRKKEVKKMAIVDITVIPIGTETTSVSPVVSEIHRLLKETNKQITFELTPMSTIIEGELPVLMELIQEIHEIPFKLGVKRVTTNIRIDDRRDKPSTMKGKIRSVEKKLAATSTNEDENI